MGAANNIITVNMVFVLLQCVGYMHADCYVREFKMLPGGYNIYMKNDIRPVFKTVKVKDATECGQLCANKNFCNVWRFGAGNCQIFHSMKDEVIAKQSSTQTTKTYYETGEDDQWMKIYSVKGGSGINVASTFLGNGDYKSWGLMSCLRTYCPEFFRSSLINAWNTLPISKVKLSLFRNKKEVLSVIFDGQGTNSKSWFQMSRVLKSPWKDFHKGALSVLFRIDLIPLRSFYTTKSIGGCSIERGWLVVSGPQTGCSWENHTSYPYILYSDKENATQWEKEHAVADVLTVYISI